MFMNPDNLLQRLYQAGHPSPARDRAAVETKERIWATTATAFTQSHTSPLASLWGRARTWLGAGAALCGVFLAYTSLVPTGPASATLAANGQPVIIYRDGQPFTVDRDITLQQGDIIEIGQGVGFATISLPDGGHSRVASDSLVRLSESGELLVSEGSVEMTFTQSGGQISTPLSLVTSDHEATVRIKADKSGDITVSAPHQPVTLTDQRDTAMTLFGGNAITLRSDASLSQTQQIPSEPIALTDAARLALDHKLDMTQYHALSSLSNALAGDQIKHQKNFTTAENHFTALGQILFSEQALRAYLPQLGQGASRDQTWQLIGAVIDDPAIRDRVEAVYLLLGQVQLTASQGPDSDYAPSSTTPAEMYLLLERLFRTQPDRQPTKDRLQAPYVTQLESLSPEQRTAAFSHLPADQLQSYSQLFPSTE